MVQKRACDTCHRRKIQCDSTNPNTPCNWCEHHGLACTFNRSRGRKKRAKQVNASGTQQNLAERLKRVEERLAQTIARQQDQSISTPTASEPTLSKPSTPTTSTTNTTHVKGSEQGLLSLREYCDTHGSPFISQTSSPLPSHGPDISFGQIHYSGCHLGHINQHNGMPILSEKGQKWVSSRTGQDVTFSRFRSSPSKPLSASLPALSTSQSCISSNQLYELPSRETLQKLVDIFFSSPFWLVFPVLDRVLFEDSIIIAYESTGEPPSINQITAKCCIFAFCSIVCLYQGGVDIPDIDSDTCAVQAHFLLADVMENTSIVTLQAIFMLHMHQVFIGRLDPAAMLHAMACRTVFMLGGHMYRPTRPYNQEATRQERETRQLRTLFWLCYIVDKDISLRLSQPPLMTADYCDLTLPEGHEKYYAYTPHTEEEMMNQPDFENLVPHLPGDPELSQLKEKTARLLYSAHAARKTDAELLQSIRELDDEVENWRLSIPPEFRPTLSISHDSRVVIGQKVTPRNMRRILLHLEYHYVMTTIHRASGRFNVPNVENTSEGREWNGGVQSSIDLSLEASRSTLIYLRAAVNCLVDQAFWIIVFYPTAAIMALWFNILLDPLDPQSSADLELLSSAADLVRSIPVRRLTPREVAYMKLVDSFVAELVRLGKCAIAKMTREREQMEQDM